ncbi:hypothetical protein [Pseudoalteromonas phage vB_Pun_Y3]
MSKRILLWGADLTPLVSSASVLLESDGTKVKLKLKDGKSVTLDESYITITDEPRKSIEPLTVDVSKKFGRKITLFDIDITKIVDSVYLSVDRGEINLSYVDDFESVYSNEEVKIIDIKECDNAGN